MPQSCANKPIWNHNPHDDPIHSQVFHGGQRVAKEKCVRAASSAAERIALLSTRDGNAALYFMPALSSRQKVSCL
jgi:hypothetical protein